MYNEYPLGLISCIAEVSAQFKPNNLEFSQRLDEIVTTEEVGISATQGICMLMLCTIVLAIFIYNINIYSDILVIIVFCLCKLMVPIDLNVQLEKQHSKQ